jgi:hypothetical protein
MGTNVFDPDDETLPDFCHEVLGLPKADIAPATAVSNTLKLFWSFLLGAFLGLALGFALGVWRAPGLVMEAWK